MLLNRMHYQMQTIFSITNRKSINLYFDLSFNFKQLWLKSKILAKYLVYNFHGLRKINLPSNRINRLKINCKIDQHNRIKVLNDVRNVNQIRNLPIRFPYIDRLIHSNANAPYLKKWRRTFKFDPTNFALITLAVQNSISEEEIQWAKLSSVIKELYNKENKNIKLDDELKNELFKFENFSFNRYIGKGCNAAIYEAHLKQPYSKYFENEKLAIKMLFNYDVESDAFEIVKAMNKECLPLGNFGIKINKFMDKQNKNKSLSHPNIVKMYGFFVDQIPDLPKAKEFFKDALPPRIYEQGYGRNMTLFIVMKRYQHNLKEYLKSNYLTQDQSLSLLLQLFSGIEYLNANSISHRDLKTDNILLEFELDQNFPSLVITDFGLCSTSLTIPYFTDDICIGGNRALTAPEIITAEPGIFSRLDYSKSDLWACGSIAYELYNNCNPFYPNKHGIFLNSYSYKESELPKPLNMPIYIETLVKQILNRDSKLRPDHEICTTLCNLLMFCDELALRCIANSKLGEKELSKKINLLLSDTLFFFRKKLNKLQIKLKIIFLMDLNLNNVKEAIQYFEV